MRPLSASAACTFADGGVALNLAYKKHKIPIPAMAVTWLLAIHIVV